MIKLCLIALKDAFDLWINLKKSPKQIEKLQNKRLRKIVKYAYENVPFYTELFDKHKIHPDNIKTVRDLRKLPLTNKEQLRNAGSKKTISKEYNIKELVKYTTSGTTADVFSIYATKSQHIKQQLLVLRCFMVGGYNNTDKILLLGPIHKPRKKWYNKLGILRRKDLDSFKSTDTMIKSAQEFKPNVLRGYPSCIRLFTLEYKKRKLDFLKIKGVFTGAEVMDSETRGIIESVFNTKVFDIYGCWEGGRIAFECKKHSGMHLSEDTIVFEFLDTKNKNEKEVVLTSLYSYAMPFIRYKIGDIVELKKGRCSCGIPFKQIKSLKGRALVDYFTLPDGSKTAATHASSMLRYSVDYPVKRYKVVQKKKDEIEVLYVRDKPLTKKEYSKVIKGYKNFVPNTKVKIIRVKKILPNKSGKYTYFESRLK